MSHFGKLFIAWDISWPVLAIFFLTLWISYTAFQWFNYNGPPFVWGLPIVGSLPFLGKEPHVTFHKLTEKYGPIFSLRLGSVNAVVLGNYDVIHEAFVLKANMFSSRKTLNFKVFDEETAFIYLDGESWKDSRNFVMNSLKTLGFGRNSLQNLVSNEINYYLQELRKSDESPFDPRPLLAKSVGNSILCLLTGERFDYSDSWQTQVTAISEELMKSYANDARIMFPSLRKIPLLNRIAISGKIRKLKNKLMSLWEDKINFYKQSDKFSADSFGLISHWFLEQEKREKNNGPNKDLYSDYSLKNNLDILTQASFDTTAITLLWAYLFLIYYPNIQKKIYAEIENKIGKDREPDINDVNDMHYTKAFMKEVHRKASIAPLGVFHSNNAKATLKEYTIPKDTTIIGNIWGVHHDPKYFPEPHEFKPERFLDKNGEMIQCEQVMPFSIGRRVCPGRLVAEMEFFLYLTSVLQKFTLSAVPGASLSLSADTNKNHVTSPKRFFMTVTPRE